MNAADYTPRQINSQEEMATLATIVCKGCGRDANDPSIRGIYKSTDGNICTDCIAINA